MRKPRWSSKIDRVNYPENKMTSTTKTYSLMFTRQKSTSPTSMIKKNKQTSQKLLKISLCKVRLTSTAKLSLEISRVSIQPKDHPTKNSRPDKWTRRKRKWRPSCFRINKFEKRRHSRRLRNRNRQMNIRELSRT